MAVGEIAKDSIFAPMRANYAYARSMIFLARVVGCRRIAGEQSRRLSGTARYSVVSIWLPLWSDKLNSRGGNKETGCIIVT